MLFKQDFLRFGCVLVGRYFDEISQDTGKYCFGVDDTFKGLELGAVETLIVWENLDVTRYTLINHSTDEERILHLTPEQEKDKTKFVDSEVWQAVLVEGSSFIFVWCDLNYPCMYPPTLCTTSIYCWLRNQLDRTGFEVCSPEPFLPWLCTYCMLVQHGVIVFNREVNAFTLTWHVYPFLYFSCIRPVDRCWDGDAGENAVAGMAREQLQDLW